MDGMEFWLATVSDSDGLYASELIWCDGDRETAWQLLGSESEVREESRRLGIPARLDGPFIIGGAQAVQNVPAAPTKGIRYTAGPWHREPLQSTHGADIAIVAPGNGWVVAVIQHDPDIQTCEEPDGDSVVWHPQDLGNADLICEGPAMVDAIRKAEDALTGDIFTDAEECAASVENARAVAGQLRTILARIDGTATPAAPDDACGQCEGKGTISGGLSGDGGDEECPVCDGSGKLPERVFVNHYTCPTCKHEWQDEWDCACDDDCPACGERHISPHTSEDSDPVADLRLAATDGLGRPFVCDGCGRPELDCSVDPCPDVIADRES